MKKSLGILLLALICLTVLSACGDQTGPEVAPSAAVGEPLQVIAAKGSGTPLPRDTVYEESTLLLDGGDWRYYQGTLSYEGQTYAAVWREGGEEPQSLCSIHQPPEEALRHEISYQLGREESAGRFLYFTIRGGETGERSLWYLDTQDLLFNQMYEAPCSNLLLPQDPGPDWQGLGWVAHEHYLIPVDLAKGSEYTAGIRDLRHILGEEEPYPPMELTDEGDGLLRLILNPGTAQEARHTLDDTVY